MQVFGLLLDYLRRDEGGGASVGTTLVRVSCTSGISSWCRDASFDSADINTDSNRGACTCCAA